MKVSLNIVCSIPLIYREMLEEQLQRWRKRSEHVMTLESEIIKYKQKLNDMALERDSDRSRLEELIEENTQLQLVAKNLNTTIDMDKSFSDNDDDCNSGDNSLSEQLTNNAQVSVSNYSLLRIHKISHIFFICRLEF